MIGLIPAHDVLRRPAGIIFCPDTKEEIETLTAMAQVYRDKLPDGPKNSRSVGNVVLGTLSMIASRDEKQGSATPCAVFSARESAFITQAAINVAGQRAYESVASQILAISLN